MLAVQHMPSPPHHLAHRRGASVPTLQPGILILPKASQPPRTPPRRQTITPPPDSEAYSTPSSSPPHHQKKQRRRTPPASATTPAHQPITPPHTPTQAAQPNIFDQFFFGPHAPQVGRPTTNSNSNARSSPVNFIKTPNPLMQALPTPRQTPNPVVSLPPIPATPTEVFGPPATVSRSAPTPSNVKRRSRRNAHDKALPLSDFESFPAESLTAPPSPTSDMPPSGFGGRAFVLNSPPESPSRHMRTASVPVNFESGVFAMDDLANDLPANHPSFAASAWGNSPRARDLPAPRFRRRGY